MSADDFSLGRSGMVSALTAYAWEDGASIAQRAWREGVLAAAVVSVPTTCADPAT